MPTALVCLDHRGDQVGLFLSAPGQRLLPVREGFGRAGRGWQVERHPTPVRVDRPLRRDRAVQVPGDQPTHRRLPLRFGLLLLGPLPGVQPQQVVAADPLLVLVRHQVGVDQLVQSVRQLVVGLTRHRLCRRQADPRAEMQSEQPEGLPRRRWQQLVGTGEHMADGLEFVVEAAQFRQPLLVVAQFPDHLCGPPRPAVDELGGDLQRERQTGAQLRQFCHLGVGQPDSTVVEQGGEHLLGVRQWQGVQVHGSGPGQTGQPVAAGHHGRTTPARRQQRPNLLDVLGVVQDHQGFPGVHDGPEARGTGFEAARDQPVRHTEAAQQLVNGRLGLQRIAHRVKAVQVQVENTVRKVLADLVAQSGCERALADAGTAADGDQPHAVRFPVRQQVPSAPQVLGAVGEVRDVRAELLRNVEQRFRRDHRQPLDLPRLHDRVR